jgi:hypothetical protein
MILPSAVHAIDMHDGSMVGLTRIDTGRPTNPLLLLCWLGPSAEIPPDCVRRNCSLAFFIRGILFGECVVFPSVSRELVCVITSGGKQAFYNCFKKKPFLFREIVMGKTLHDRVRLKERYALFNFNRMQMAALAASAALVLAMAFVQVL